jgi:hypothetical protein
LEVVPVEKPKRTPRTDARGVWVLTVNELIDLHVGRDLKQPRV